MISDSGIPQGPFDSGPTSYRNAVKIAIRIFSTAANKIERIDKRYHGTEHTLSFIKSRSEKLLKKYNLIGIIPPGKKIPSTDRAKYFFEKKDYFIYRITKIIEELVFEKETVESFIDELESSIEIIELEIVKLSKIKGETGTVRKEIAQTIENGNRVKESLKGALERMEKNAHKIQAEIKRMERSIQGGDK